VALFRSTNPVLGRIGTAQPRYTVAGGPALDYRAGYQTDLASPVQTGIRDVMTLDDVVVKTVTLLGLTSLVAAITWVMAPVGALYPLWITAALVGFVVGLIISFAQVTNPVVIGAYAVVEGVLLGAVSKAYNGAFGGGIVASAVIATLGVFTVMAALYKFRVIRATPRFMKIVIGIAAGLAVVMLVNFVIYLISGSVTPLRDGGPIAIIFSLICITVAALMFVVSFRQIEDGIQAGLPRRYGWLGAFGILVEIVWMYLEFLRLLSYFSED
jgi:uncharacterized YccA/Bax inhibitor family protein